MSVLLTILRVWGAGGWREGRSGLRGGVKEEKGGTVTEEGGHGGGVWAWGLKSQQSLCNRSRHTPHLKLIQSGTSTALSSAGDTQT